MKSINGTSDTGTWLNNQRLPKNQPVRLNPGDVIMLANSENTFIVTYNEISHQNETSSEDFTKRDSTQMNNRQSESFRKKFFSYQGRLNRKPYFFRVFPLSIISSILLEILVELDEIPYDELSAGAEFMIYAIILLVLPMVVSCYMNGVRRLHDLNKSGSNRYGSDPLERR